MTARIVAGLGASEAVAIREHGRRIRAMPIAALRAAVLLAACWQPALAAAPDMTVERLLGAKRLICVETVGSCVDWNSGKPALSECRFDSPYVIERFDRDRNQVEISGKGGKHLSRYIADQSSITIIEPTAFGPLFTTVLPILRPGTRNEVITVHSRHIALLGVPSIAQYHGTCVVE